MTNKFDRIHTNTNKKYIIRNCPCIKHSDEIELDNRCMSTQDDVYFFCEDNTDCVMKQIVELCKPLNIKQPESYYDLEVLLAKRILQLLDIQEVE